MRLAVRAGDVIAVQPRRVGTRERLGEILEVLGEPGHEHFRVRWEDGYECIFYPGGDAIVHRRMEEADDADR